MFKIGSGGIDWDQKPEGDGPQKPEPTSAERTRERLGVTGKMPGRMAGKEEEIPVILAGLEKTEDLCTVEFKKAKKKIRVPKGANLRTAMIEAGIDVYAGVDKLLNCRGKGLCGTCRVLVKNQSKENINRLTLREMGRRAIGWAHIGCEAELRLSCCAKVQGDLIVENVPFPNWFGDDMKKPVFKKD